MANVKAALPELAAGGGDLGGVAPLERRLGGEGDQGQQRQQRGDGEGGDEVVLVVEDLDVQRHGVGLAADVAGDHGDGAELAHRARVAQQHAVEQAPADVGQGHPPEDLPAAGAQHDRRLLVLAPLLLHERDQLAGDEREGDEDGGQHDAGQREDDLDVVGLEPGADPAMQAEHQDVDHAGDDGRDRERQIDQGQQQMLAAELELGDAPGGGDAEDQVQGHRDRRHQQRELDGGKRIGLDQGRQIGADALAQRLDEDRQQRQEQEQHEEGERRQRQQPLRQRRFLQSRLLDRRLGADGLGEINHGATLSNAAAG